MIIHVYVEYIMIISIVIMNIVVRISTVIMIIHCFWYVYNFTALIWMMHTIVIINIKHGLTIVIVISPW